MHCLRIILLWWYTKKARKSIKSLDIRVKDRVKDGIEKILGGNQLQMLITGASAMGAIVLGALSSQFVTVNCAAVIKFGALEMNVQETVFDALFKGILPLGITMLTLYLLKNRKMKATTVMGILILIGLAGGVIGFLG